MAARTKKTESFEDGLNRLEEMAQEIGRAPRLNSSHVF